MQVGLITAIFWGCFAIPQFWAAYLSETKPIKKFFIGKVIITSSIAWFVLAMYILFAKTYHPSLSIWLFLIMFAWACTIKAFDVPANTAMLFKLIPTERLGQLSGISGSIQYSGIVLAGFAITMINRSFEKPLNFSVLFLLTFIISLLSSVIMFSIDEPANETSKRSLSHAAFLKKWVHIIKTDRIFTRFIIGKWMMTGQHVILAFLLAYLINKRGIDSITAGWFSSLHALGSIIAGFTISRLTDIYGPKFMMILSQVFAVIYTCIAVFTPSTAPFVIISIFIITGITMAADWSGFGYMMVTCSPEEDKSTYVAITCIGVNIFTVPLPLIAGKIMDMGLLSYTGMFSILCMTTLGAILYILIFVENPAAFKEMRAARNTGN